MFKVNRSWLVVAALAAGASGAAWAGDGGAGGDSGDNGMNPMYGDSYALLEVQGHNAGTTRIAPEGAFAAHEMDGQTTSLMEQMRQTQHRIMDQAHAAAQRMRSALNLPPSSSTSTTNPSSGATYVAPSSTEPSTGSGYQIAPTNPSGQAPTVTPSGR